MRRVSGLRRKLVVSVEDSTLIPTSHKKQDPDPLVASSVRVFCAQNLQREGRTLPREGWGPVFQLDVGIILGLGT